MLHPSCCLCSLVLLVGAAPTRAQDQVRFRSGNIVVKQYEQSVRDDDGNEVRLTYFNLLRDGINFGHGYDDARCRKNGTTYYHAQGPVGLTFARLVTDMAQPPVAVIGMNTGTLAVYARPRQKFHFFEPEKTIIDLLERKGKEAFFPAVADARERGADIKVFHGAPRQQLKEQAPRGFYHLIVLEACSGENGEKIFLDLFTREGIADCFERLAENGVLAVHTSHRFVDLPSVLAAIGKDLKLHVRRGHDNAPGADHGRTAPLKELAHFTSEWVLLARSDKVLAEICKAPAGYEELMRKNKGRDDPYWTTPEPLKEVWTDKGPNHLHGVLRSHPIVMRYRALATPIVEFIADGLKLSGVRRQDLYQLTVVPHSVDEYLVQRQLRVEPRVDRLWP